MKIREMLAQYARTAYGEAMETMCEQDAAEVIGAVVLDESRKGDLPTGRVTVTAPEGVTDAELAEVAGFGPRHYGVNVTRYDDGTAVVHLWND